MLSSDWSFSSSFQRSCVYSHPGYISSWSKKIFLYDRSVLWISRYFSISDLSGPSQHWGGKFRFSSHLWRWVWSYFCGKSSWYGMRNLATKQSTGDGSHRSHSMIHISSLSCHFSYVHISMYPHPRDGILYRQEENGGVVNERVHSDTWASFLIHSCTRGCRLEKKKRKYEKQC